MTQVLLNQWMGDGTMLRFEVEVHLFFVSALATCLLKFSNSAASFFSDAAYDPDGLYEPLVWLYHIAGWIQT